ncbi:MAG: DNA polymerase III subunit delta [Saccharofermentanales bacterium]
MKQKEAIGFKEVLQNLKKGIIAPVYVFEGDEAYLKNKLLNAFKTLLIEPAAITLDYVVYDYANQVSKVDIHQIMAEVKTPPFLSKKRLVVVKNSNLFLLSGKNKSISRAETTDDEQKDETDAADDDSSQSVTKDRQSLLIDLIKSDIDSSCLIFIEDKVDKRMKNVVEAIRGAGVLATISKPDLRDIRLWVAGEFTKSGMTISSDVMEYFIDRYDGNLQVMTGEIDKLKLYIKACGKNSFDIKDVDEIGSPDFKGSIFDIVDALSKNDAQEAFRLLDLLITQKQPVPFISFMIARHIRQLITAKDLGDTSEIIKKMKVIPFVANKLYYQAKNFTFETLEDLYNKCYETDLAVKTSKIQDRLALETLFASMAGKSNTLKNKLI